MLENMQRLSLCEKEVRLALLKVNFCTCFSSKCLYIHLFIQSSEVELNSS